MACCDAAWTSATVGCEGSMPCASSDLLYNEDYSTPCNPRGGSRGMAACVPTPQSIHENLGLAYALSAKMMWADWMEDKSTAYSMSSRGDADAQSRDFDEDLYEAAAACEEPTLQAAADVEPDQCWEPTLQAEESEEQPTVAACQEPTLQAHTSRQRWADLSDSDMESETIVTQQASPMKAQLADSEAEEKGEVYIPAPRNRRSERNGRRVDEMKNVSEEKGWKSWEQPSSNTKSWDEPKGKKSWEEAGWNATVQHKAGGKGGESNAKGGKASGKGEKGNHKGHGKAAGKGWNAEGGKKSGKGAAKGASKGAGKGGAAKYQCQFVIGIEEDSKFRVVRRLIGSGGEHMKAIYEKTGAKLRLRGRGSKFLEGPEQQESTDPLMLCISANDWDAYAGAQRLVTELLEGIYQSYRVHCKKAGQTNPELRIQMHEGYREGSR